MWPSMKWVINITFVDYIRIYREKKGKEKRMADKDGGRGRTWWVVVARGGSSGDGGGSRLDFGHAHVTSLLRGCSCLLWW